MSKQRIEDCYFEHNSTIFSEMLGEDEEYLRLKKAKRAAEEALQSVISKEAWNQYLALDEICNELECARYKAMYLAGTLITKNYPNDLNAASGRHFSFAIGVMMLATTRLIAQFKKQGHDRCGLPEKSHGLY